MKTREDFLAEIGKNCRNRTEYLIELLKVRGFLFEKLYGELHMSDTSFKEDAPFLNELLRQYGYGHLEGKKVVINPNPDPILLEALFVNDAPIEGSYEGAGGSGSKFKHRVHGESVPVKLLDPFIARYVKAITACSVPTTASCDGNHPQMNQMFLMIKDRTSRIWHKLICMMLLAGVYDIRWNSDCTAVEFDESVKYQTYFEMNRAAEYLYDNRQEIRKILNSAMREMAGSFFLNHSAEEIEKAFISKVSMLFCNSPLMRIR